MHSNELKRTAPDELIAFSRQHMNAVLSNVSGVDFVMLCSADGFELASVYKKNRSNLGKLAAVSSSILAMVQAFVSEIDLHDCENITLDAVNGKAILTAIPHPAYPMVMVVLSSKDVLLGQLLYSIKKTVQSIQQQPLHAVVHSLV